ncbi:hypothetical protein LTQ56_02280 [Mycobacterium intracellulare subsp. intracellulare]|uniref:hypothetical protein n=1 Tax=Mycobacterium intracellulare TaxID=1767 RepID=UPI001928A637|nr:hypothetical protein [Mycobacterium intracellulare]UGU07567.1 hypothetical protein LTQ56_02280 [Mycobacterium intracellulare subsp. intracellulare]BCO56465.1 hypothetical protein MINTM005_17090 [Mycobacterium intracellulare]BCO93606.1 hypothetical protein MINTM016_15820 [Mycobacterium intracellulare]
MSGLQTGQVSVSTTATLVCNVGSVPDSDGVLITASAPAFVGGAGVTAATGFPVATNTPTLIPTTGAESVSVYAITSSGTATVSYIFPG